LRATGIVRKVDDLGRLVIPKEMRNTLGIDEGTPMEFFVDKEGSIVVRRYAPNLCCSECGSYGVKLVGKSRICVPCAEKLAKGE
jgi:transcriptional pleiotropic regulator of transition state genes